VLPVAQLDLGLMLAMDSEPRDRLGCEFVRLVLVFVSPNTGARPALSSVQRIVSLPAYRSTSVQRSAASSPRRAPESRASV
jgi:hypothetical protein